MPVYDIYQNRKTAEIFQDTWGHLAPKIGQKYFGYIVIALAAYGDNVIFDCDFAKNDDPWLFEDVCEFAFAKTDGAERPGLYRFDGWYKKFKNGNYRFGGGKFRKVY